MKKLFLTLLNMSISASWVVLAVLLLRLALKKAPKAIRCALWVLVAVRLVCPFSFESRLSLMPRPVSEESLAAVASAEPGEITGENAMVPSAADPSPETDAYSHFSALSAGISGKASASAKSGGTTASWQTVCSILWAVGMAAMVLYAIFSYLRLYRSVKASVDLGQGVALCDYIDTPFILGLVKPKIYLPSGLSSKDAAHVLAHERAHLKRRDHWWKPLGFALLSVYWFNPLLWLAYVLLCRDIELACDERVVREMGISGKKAYSEALLNCSIPKHRITACPLAFGEVGVKERVKNVLNYKKPAFWISAVGIAAIVIAAICFLTNPKPETLPADEIPQSTEETNEWSDEDLLKLCKEALTGFQKQNRYYLSTQSIFHGYNALNTYSTTKLWKNGNDFLRAIDIEEALEKWQYVEMNGKQYESHYNGYGDQDENDLQWWESSEDLSQNFEEWLHSFDWDTAKISLKSAGDQVGFQTVTCAIEKGWITEGMHDSTSEITFVLDAGNALRTVMYNVKYTDSTGYPINDFRTTTILSYNEYVIVPEIEAAFQTAEKS